jgi:hypothetical protein
MEDSSLTSMNSTVDLVLTNLRIIAKSAIDSDDYAQLLRRIIRIYSKSSFRKLVDVPKELIALIQHKAGISTIDYDSEVLEFVLFLTDEVIPSDLLRAFVLGEASPIVLPELLLIIKRVLARGILFGGEISSSLLRIKVARQRLEVAIDGTNPNGGNKTQMNGIWARMADGTLMIEKR